MDRIFVEEFLLSEKASKHSKKRCMVLRMKGQRNVGGADRHKRYIED